MIGILLRTAGGESHGLGTPAQLRQLRRFGPLRRLGSLGCLAPVLLALALLSGCAGGGRIPAPPGGPPAAGAATDEPPAEEPGRWVVMLPGGADASEADELASTLAWELDAPVSVLGRGGVWSVLVGEASSRPEAEALRDDLRERGHRSAALVDLSAKAEGGDGSAQGPQDPPRGEEGGSALDSAEEPE